MNIVQIEKNKTENYPIYIVNSKDSEDYKSGAVFNSFKKIVNWNYEKANEYDYIYSNVTEIINDEPNNYLEGLAYALRFSEENNSNLFLWMIMNFNELLEQDIDSVTELTTMLWTSLKNNYEKKTKAEREIIPFSKIAEEIIMEFDAFPMRDVISLSTILEAFVSWKHNLLSMEEYYEIRDMFVPYGLSISQSKLTTSQILPKFEKKLNNPNNYSLMKKTGKMTVIDSIDSNIVKDALEELYFDESAND